MTTGGFLIVKKVFAYAFFIKIFNEILKSS